MKFLSLAALLVGLVPSLAVAQDVQPFKYPSWMWEEGDVATWHKARLQEFEAKHPELKVEATLVPAGNFENVIDTQIAAGDVPDLLPVFTNMLPSLIDAGALEPLDACIAKSSFKDRMLPSVSFAQKDGKTYGVPLTMSPQSMIYNKKLLAKAGITAPPTTLDEFYADAKAIKEKTGAWGYAFPNNPPDALWNYIVSMQWVLGLGGDWAKADGTITADDPKTVEAITWIKRFLDEGLAPKGLDFNAERTLFAQGKVAFTFEGPWLMTQVQSDNPALYPDIGFAVMPTPTHAAVTGGAYYTIPAGATHADAACDYLNIINAEPAQRDWLQHLLQIPGTSVQPSAGFLKQQPWVATMAEVAAKYPGGLGYSPPGYGVHAAEFRQIVANHLAEIYSGQKSVKDGLAAAQAELTKWAANL